MYNGLCERMEQIKFLFGWPCTLHYGLYFFIKLKYNFGLMKDKVLVEYKNIIA